MKHWLTPVLYHEFLQKNNKIEIKNATVCLQCNTFYSRNVYLFLFKETNFLKPQG